MPKACLIFLLTIFALSGLSMLTNAQAKDVEFLHYKVTPSSTNDKIATLVTTALQTEIQQFKSDYAQSTPAIQYATTDLNGDGNPEIVARFFEDYFQTDNNRNSRTYVFAYTSKGLIKIFDQMAGDIAIGHVDKTGLRQIIAFRGMTPQYDVYTWDGARRYAKSK